MAAHDESQSYRPMPETSTVPIDAFAMRALRRLSAANYSRA